MMSALHRADGSAGDRLWRSTSSKRHLAGAFLLLAFGLAALQSAQGQTPTPEPLVVEPIIEDDDLLTTPDADPPARVARLGLLAGDVDIAPAGSEDWAEAVLNRPLTSGDRLWVQHGARTELQIASTVLYLDGTTRFGFITLDDDVLQASLTQGTATVRVRRLSASETLQIETPQATVVLREVGEYHLEVAADGGATVVKTRNGLAEVHGAREVHRVSSGQAVQFTGLEPLHASTGMLGERTAFEDWANQRDARAVHSSSAQYVAEDVIGYEDLDEHGQWQHEPEYGPVWQPRQVASDWAPYRDGRWGWVAPWGWTWIDASHWGFAPFHYGRWVQIRQRWCWVPGPRHHRAVYSPALVGWVGSAPVNVTVNIGNIGWFPLGPRDLYRPGYRHSRHYIQRINLSNSVFITQGHFHRGVPVWPRFDARRHHHGFTGVRYDLFVGAHLVRGNHLRLDHQGLRQWHAHHRPPAFLPYRESVLIGRRRQGPSHELRQRDFHVGRIPFHRERHAIEANGGRPLDRLQLRGDARRDRNDFITQRRQWQQEFGLRNAADGRIITGPGGNPRNQGNRLLREDRQGFDQGFDRSRRLDDGSRGRITRDANGERLQIIRAEENRRGFQPGNRGQYPPPRNVTSPEDRQRWRGTSPGAVGDDRQRWRSPPSNVPGREPWRNRPGADDRGSSRFITQPGQRDGQTNRPGRSEQRDRTPPRAAPPSQPRNFQPNRPQGNQQWNRNPPQRNDLPRGPARSEQRDGGGSRFMTQPRQRDAQPSRPRTEQRAQPRPADRSPSRGSPPQRSDRSSGAKRQTAPWNSGK